MSFFFVLTPPGDQRLVSARLARYLPGAPGDVTADRTWRLTTLLNSVAGIDPSSGRPAIASSDDILAVGDVRLDDRDDTARRLGLTVTPARDLDVVVAALRRRGPAGIDELRGDFAFVVWDASTNQLLAARDAFGIRTLYYRQYDGEIAFSSHASLLASRLQYDPEYVGRFLLGRPHYREGAIYRGATAIPTAGLLTLHDGRLAVTRHWKPEDHLNIATGITPQEACQRFKELLVHAVAQCVTAGPDTWSYLSGGLDTAAIVCCSSVVLSQGKGAQLLGGTVTYADSVGIGDERKYVSALTSHTGLRNIQVADYWLWQDDGLPPPRTEVPESYFPMWARERALLTRLREHGVRVLLCGNGADHYLVGNFSYLADWLVRGRLLSAMMEIARLAVLTRSSTWRVAYDGVIAPFLPERWYSWPVTSIASREPRTPPWFRRALVTRYDLDRPFYPWGRIAPVFHKYQGSIANILRGAGYSFERNKGDNGIELRYPFFYRPLVEFCLGLPPLLRTQPTATKWILRQAMRDIIPDAVRLRRGKGSITGRFEWSLDRERATVDSLLRDPLLADMGFIDAVALGRAVNNLRARRLGAPGRIVAALALETWLRVQSGRWPPTSSRLPPIHETAGAS
jgi:asparagine synthase (glutamine-hydrolysing)